MRGVSQPPDVQLIAGDQALAGQLGSFTYAGRAVDRRIAIPPVVASVRTGSHVHFSGPGPQPNEVHLFVYRLADVSIDDIRPVWEGELISDAMEWLIPLDTGKYVLALFRVWKGYGDAIHLFSMEVLPEES